MMAERIWIIGNGPSLRAEDLFALNDEITFGMNWLHLLPGIGDWMPTYWGYYDACGQGWHDDVSRYVNSICECILRIELAYDFFHSKAWKSKWPINVHSVPMCPRHQGMDITHPDKPRAWHLPTLCGFASGLFVNMQYAIMKYPDLEQIILLGCDLGFRPFGPDEADPNHFHPAYGCPNDHLLEKRDVTLRWAHTIAKMECRRRGIEVINATRGGALEVYPRVELDQMLSS